MMRLRQPFANRLRLAELTSGLGAGVLGVGVGVLFASTLRTIALPMLVIGLAMHAWGMADKHRLEAQTAKPTPWWSAAFYWICWIALLAVAVYVVIGPRSGHD